MFLGASPVFVCVTVCAAMVTDQTAAAGHCSRADHRADLLPVDLLCDGGPGIARPRSGAARSEACLFPAIGGSCILGRMPVSRATRELCRVTFVPESVDLALCALEAYEGPEADWVHKAAVRLSEGHLHRLAHWLSLAEEDPGTFRWYAHEAVDVSPESHSFAVDFVRALMDKDVPRPPLDPTG